MPAEILFTFIRDLFNRATDRKGNVMAKSNDRFKKRQKELPERYNGKN